MTEEAKGRRRLLSRETESNEIKTHTKQKEYNIE